MLWRCGFSFLDFSVCDGNDSIGFGIGDRFLRAGLFREELIHDAFPAITEDSLAFGGKYLTCTLRGYGSLNKSVRLRNSCQQPNRNQSQNLLFSLGQGFEIYTGNRLCGDDGMVIGYLFVVDDLLRVQGHFTAHMEQCCNSGNQLLQNRRSIFGKIAAVRPGIGDQLLFIQGLGVVEGLLGCESKNAVGVPLKCRQVIEFRGFLCPLFSFNGLNQYILFFLAGFQKTGCAVPVRKSLTSQLHAIDTKLDSVERLRYKCGNRCFTLDGHTQCGCHDSANGKRLTIQA